ncbi:MAG: MBL fold metallo-hydrolase [Candidatus Caldatribacteriota bacterium]
MTKLIFLGTKGEIEEENIRHQYHSSIIIEEDDFKLLIDYGRKHPLRLEEIKADVILITHAHPDHYIWLEQDIKTPTPIYLTEKTVNYGKYKPENCKIIQNNQIYPIGPLEIIPYPVLHSLRCPTVGFKIKTLKSFCLVYNPDVVDIVEKDKILTGVNLFIGDGSSWKINLVRRRGSQFFGHTRITTQLNWCKRFKIKDSIFTHLGKELLEKEREFSEQFSEVKLAYDGMEIWI